MVPEPTTQNHDKYLSVTLATSFSMPVLLDLIGYIKSEADRTHHTRVLVDTSGMTGSMTEADRFVGGTQMAAVFGPRLKVAILMPPTQITKLGELAAVNRGARVHVTADHEDALSWLLA